MPKIYNLSWLTNQPWENKSQTMHYELEKGEIIQDFTMKNPLYFGTFKHKFHARPKRFTKIIIVFVNYICKSFKKYSQMLMLYYLQ